MSAPCFKCGTPCGRTACVFEGVEVAGGFLCAKHLDEAFAEMEIRRSEFEALPLGHAGAHRMGLYIRVR